MRCAVVYVGHKCSVFFFKQKTAYEMRISDWSSDVCSSDLTRRWAVRLLSGMSATARRGRFAGCEWLVIQIGEWPRPRHACGVRLGSGGAGTDRTSAV